ncbi:hypothetical protein G9A89_010286 [Geosiphon pyriformis]|nr:hypothetical protein G9A89_010286 [Geosiphon pyriformis]
MPFYETFSFPQSIKFFPDTEIISFHLRNQTLFSITETALEISIIADVDSIQRDFVQLQRISPNVEITKDVFKALILENEDGLGSFYLKYSLIQLLVQNKIVSTRKRINDLSALLSRVGVSIFYLSTYQEDFLLVKEKRIPLVVSTLQPIFTFEHSELFQKLSPFTSLLDDHQPTIITKVVDEGEDEFCFPVGSEPIHIDYLKPLHQSQSNSSHSHTPKEYLLSSSPVFFTSNFAERFRITKYQNEEETMAEVRRQCPKRVTGHRLRLFGLNRDYRFLSYTATADGISLVTDESILDEFPEHMLNMSSVPIPLRCIQMDLSIMGSLDKYGIVYSISNPLISSDINLLYLSTYKTANVLVQDSDLKESLKILDNVDEETQLQRDLHEFG